MQKVALSGGKRTLSKNSASVIPRDHPLESLYPQNNSYRCKQSSVNPFLFQSLKSNNSYHDLKIISSNKP